MAKLSCRLIIGLVFVAASHNRFLLVQIKRKKTTQQKSRIFQTLNITTTERSRKRQNSLKRKFAKLLNKLGGIKFFRELCSEFFSNGKEQKDDVFNPTFPRPPEVASRSRF